VGPIATIDAIAESFADAAAALETAWRFKRPGVHTLEGLGLLPTVITSGRVGDHVSERLVDAVAREGPAGEALVQTVSAYLERGLQAGETAQALHLHPNSLRKRLRRYEELTGVDLHNMDDLAAIWWALKRKEIAA
jgi:DNA-binding PucR family transcriptional regulator